MYYHYNTVQQLKALYNEILQPEMLRDEMAIPPEQSKMEGKGGRRGEERGGGGGKKDHTSKEKKETGLPEGKKEKAKTEPSKESVAIVSGMYSKYYEINHSRQGFNYSSLAPEGKGCLWS